MFHDTEPPTSLHFQTSMLRHAAPTLRKLFQRCRHLPQPILRRVRPDRCASVVAPRRTCSAATGTNSRSSGTRRARCSPRRRPSRRPTPRRRSPPARCVIRVVTNCVRVLGQPAPSMRGGVDHTTVGWFPRLGWSARDSTQHASLVILAKPCRGLCVVARVSPCCPGFCSSTQTAASSACGCIPVATPPVAASRACAMPVTGRLTQGVRRAKAVFCRLPVAFCGAGLTGCVQIASLATQCVNLPGLPAEP